MDWNHYNGPQMTPEQIHAYLDRIACPGPIPLTLAGLTRLLQAHQQAVPFENLDVLAGRPLSLDHEALFDKIDPNHFVLCHVAVFLLKNIRSVIVFATLRTVENPIHLTVRITP